MKTTVNFSQFCDSFSETYKHHFTYEGKRALFDYLTEYEESTGEELELDPIAFCCDFTEYDDMADFQAVYGNDYENLEDVEQETTVIPIEHTDRFIISGF